MALDSQSFAGDKAAAQHLDTFSHIRGFSGAGGAFDAKTAHCVVMADRRRSPRR